jgi:hypothetical protein
VSTVPQPFGSTVGSFGDRQHPRAFHHLSAAQGIAAGFDVVTAGSRLGHSDLPITLRVFSHEVEQRNRGLAASFARTLAAFIEG